jgi:hypothetical protein
MRSDDHTQLETFEHSEAWPLADVRNQVLARLRAREPRPACPRTPTNRFCCCGAAATGGNSGCRAGPARRCGHVVWPCWHAHAQAPEMSCARNESRIKATSTKPLLRNAGPRSRVWSGALPALAASAAGSIAPAGYRRRNKKSDFWGRGERGAGLNAQRRHRPARPPSHGAAW